MTQMGDPVADPVAMTIDLLQRPVAVAPAEREPRSAWALTALVPLALVAYGLAVFARDDLTGGEVVRGLLVAGWALAGAALASRSQLRPFAKIVLAGATVAGIGFVGCAALADKWTGTGHDGFALARPITVALLPAIGFVALLALPHGALGTRARRVTAFAGLASAFVAGIALWTDRPDLPVWPIWLLGLVLLAAAVPAAHRSYQETAGLDRQRLQWVGCAVAVVAEAALVLLALEVFTGWPDNVSEPLAAISLILPLALAAWTSNRLVSRADRLLVHTVSVAGLTGVVVAVYLVIVLGLGRVPNDSERHLLVLSMVAAAVSVALYLPARRRLAEVANRLVYGERQAPDEVLSTFGSRLSRAIPMDELLLQLAESLKKTMALACAEVWTGTPERLERTTSVPDRGSAVLQLTPAEQPVVARAGVSGNAWAEVWVPTLLHGREDRQLRIAPVAHSGELLGLIIVERPGNGDPFTEEDERVLTELARQVGLALHNVQLDSALQASLDEVRRQAEELRASRARLVAAADAERRKIERNLHDGAQQQLVALAVNLRLAKDIISDDPETAAEMLDELAQGVKDTIQELRDLAHGIYPPLLMDSGLGEAMRAAANRSPLEVDVTADGIGRYPTEVEAAVYFCCLEALQNASKHAPDAHVAVRLWEEEQALRFEIADDGPGFDPATATRGHGFTNMSDRLGAIGGTVRWDSAPGEGSKVAGTVPVE
jgi:signal transduction histidine kinase